MNNSNTGAKRGVRTPIGKEEPETRKDMLAELVRNHDDADQEAPLTPQLVAVNQLAGHPFSA